MLYTGVYSGKSYLQLLYSNQWGFALPAPLEKAKRIAEWLKQHGISCRKKKNQDIYVCFVAPNIRYEIQGDRVDVVVTGDAFLNPVEESVSGGYSLDLFLARLREQLGAADAELEIHGYPEVELRIRFENAERHKGRLLMLAKKLKEMDFGIEYVLSGEGRLRLYRGDKVVSADRVLGELGG